MGWIIFFLFHFSYILFEIHNRRHSHTRKHIVSRTKLHTTIKYAVFACYSQNKEIEEKPNLLLSSWSYFRTITVKTDAFTAMEKNKTKNKKHCLMSRFHFITSINFPWSFELLTQTLFSYCKYDYNLFR